VIKTIWQRIKSKTYWLAIMVAVSANLPGLRDILGDHYGLVSLVVAVLIAALREATKEPISAK